MFLPAMGKKKVPGSKGGAKQEAKELKKKKQEEKASKAAKKRSGKVNKLQYTSITLPSTRKRRRQQYRLHHDVRVLL